MFEDVDTELPGSPPPEESDNRTFLIAAGILGGITLISLICMAIYAIVWVPRTRVIRLTEAAADALARSQATADAIQARTQTAEAAQPTATNTPTVTNTPTSSATPVIAQATNTPDLTDTPGPRTATVAALLTQAAQQTQTVIITSTELPDTGFADDVGIPMMLAMAIVFVAVIFLVRRMRAVTG